MGRNDETPLMTAVKKNNDHIVNLLIEYGADVNAKNSKGQTAMVYLGMGHLDRTNLDCTKLLLENGANLEETKLDPFRLVPPIIIHGAQIQTDYLKLYIKYDCDLEIRNELGETLLMAKMLDMDIFDLIFRKLLKKYNGKTEHIFNLKYANSNNLLQEAINRNCFNTVLYLTDLRIDPFIRNKDGMVIHSSQIGICSYFF